MYIMFFYSKPEKSIYLDETKVRIVQCGDGTFVVEEYWCSVDGCDWFPKKRYETIEQAREGKSALIKERSAEYRSQQKIRVVE